ATECGSGLARERGRQQKLRGQSECRPAAPTGFEFTDNSRLGHSLPVPPAPAGPSGPAAGRQLANVGADLSANGTDSKSFAAKGNAAQPLPQGSSSPTTADSDIAFRYHQPLPDRVALPPGVS